MWGIGHTLTLLIVGTAFLYLDTIVPERLAGTVLYIQMPRTGTRNHGRHYADFAWGRCCTPHVKRPNPFSYSSTCWRCCPFPRSLHSHKGELEHILSQHEHNHSTEFPLRALIVGLVHGLAGSAALVLLTLQTIQLSPLIGILYIVLFGVGSIIGMAAISLVIVIPFYYSGKGLTWVHNGLKCQGQS